MLKAVQVSYAPYPQPKSKATPGRTAQGAPKLVISVKNRFEDQRAFKSKTSSAKRDVVQHAGANKQMSQMTTAPVEYSKLGSDSGPSTDSNVTITPRHLARQTARGTSADLSFDRLTEPVSADVNQVAASLQQLSAKIERRTGHGSIPRLTMSSLPPGTRSIQVSERPSVLSPSFFRKTSPSEREQYPVEDVVSPIFKRRKRIRPSVSSETSTYPTPNGLLAQLVQKQIELDYAQTLNSRLVENLRSMQQRIARLERLSINY
jgi:hypothetical protein